MDKLRPESSDTRTIAEKTASIREKAESAIRLTSQTIGDVSSAEAPQTQEPVEEKGIDEMLADARARLDKLLAKNPEK